MVAGLRASAQPRHLADLAPASAPSSSMPHEPSSLLPSPAAAESLPPACPVKQHASAVLAAAGIDMRGPGGATAPAAEPQEGEGGSGGSGAGTPGPALAAGAGVAPAQQGNGAGQPQPPDPASAAAAAPNPGITVPAAGPPPSPGAAAAAELEAILGRLMQIDKEGWFRHPVSELVAPKYYKIIKQPMCFEVGAGKTRACRLGTACATAGMHLCLRLPVLCSAMSRTPALTLRLCQCCRCCVRCWAHSWRACVLLLPGDSRASSAAPVWRR